MAFAVEKVGHHVAARADRIAVARYASDNKEAITLIWNGSHVKHTLWTLLPNGDLYPTELNSHSGGPELTVASFSKTRVVSMHRSGPAAALKFEAWKTGGIFELSDDALGPADRDPEIEPFGGEPGILPVPAPAPLRAATRSGSPVEPSRNLPPGPPPPTPVVVAGKIVIKMGPKAGHAVVASITQDHHLRLSMWGFDDGGDYKVLVGKYVEADGGKASVVSVAKVKEHWKEGPYVTGVEVVTAAKSEAALKLQRWRINLGSQGVPSSIQLLSEQVAAESIKAVSATPVMALNGTQVATAVRLEDDTLKVIGWKMETDGGMTRWVDASGGPISAVSAALVRGRNIVTAMREADGRLKVSYWRFPSTFAGTLEHRGDMVEGKVGMVKCAHVPGEGSQLGDTVVAAQTEDGKLQMFRYRVTE